MGSLGGLYGMIMGQKGLADMEAKRRYESENAEKIRQFNITSGNQSELLKRAHPLPTETAAEIGTVAGQGDPTALSNLFMFEGKHTPEEMESMIGKNKAEANYYNQAAGQKDDTSDLKRRELDIKEKGVDEVMRRNQMNEFEKKVKDSLAPGYGPGDYDEALFKMAGPKASELFMKPTDDPNSYKMKINKILQRADDLEKTKPVQAEILRGAVRHIQNAQPDLFPSSVKKPGILDQLKNFLGGSQNPDEQIQ